MLHEPKKPPQRKKHGENICVGSMVICIIAGLMWIAETISGTSQYDYIGEFFFWILVLFMIPICGFICSWILDYPRGTRRQAKSLPSC
ncbi:MAG: hypothetical protein ACXABN_14480 [Candidatus Thorarchaeota archaeon]|jgi:hypothetical protein